MMANEASTDPTRDYGSTNPPTSPTPPTPPPSYGKIERGTATDFWLELVAYPAGSARSLWLLVGGKWRYLDDPKPNVESSVQAAFCNCPESMEVAVWYNQNDNIVGLVVRSNKK